MLNESITQTTQVLQGERGQVNGFRIAPKQVGLHMVWKHSSGPSDSKHDATPHEQRIQSSRTGIEHLLNDQAEQKVSQQLERGVKTARLSNVDPHDAPLWSAQSYLETLIKVPRDARLKGMYS